MTRKRENTATRPELAVGIDIGSTTTKVVVLDPSKGDILYSDYRRHHADQVKSVEHVMEQLEQRFPGQAVPLLPDRLRLQAHCRGLGPPLRPGGGSQRRRVEAPL